MKCYLCYLQTGTAASSALGICQRCGAGICEQHLISVEPSPVYGMAGMAQKSRYVLCSLCSQPTHAGRSPHSEALSNKKQPWWCFQLWEKWRRRSSQHVLPEPEEAVVAVEQFLRSQKSEGE